MLSRTMPFRRHSISTCMNPLIFLLGFLSTPLSSVLGLPAFKSIFEAATSSSHGTGAVGSAERVTTDFTHIATTSAAPRNEHGPSYLAKPTSKASSNNKPITTAKEAVPTSAHPSFVVRPDEDGPKTVFAKMSRFFNRIFGRNNIAKLNSDLKNFFSSLTVRSKPLELTSNDVPWQNAHWKTLTIKNKEGLIKEAKFDILDPRTLEELYKRDKDLNALWQSYLEEMPVEKKLVLISDAYNKFLNTPLKQLTSDKCEGWIYTLAYKLNIAENNAKHVDAPLEALSQFLLLDMQAKFRSLNTVEGNKLWATSGSLQDYLKTRFLVSMEPEDKIKLDPVPWSHELFYYDSDDTVWFNQANNVQLYFEKRQENGIVSTINSLVKKVKVPQADMETELAKFSRMLEKDNPDIPAQKKTALFLFLADIAFNRHPSTLLDAKTKEAQLAVKSMFSQMFSQKTLMTHNMQRLHFLEPQSFPLKIEPSTVPS